MILPTSELKFKRPTSGKRRQLKWPKKSRPRPRESETSRKKIMLKHRGLQLAWSPQVPW